MQYNNSTTIQYFNATSYKPHLPLCHNSTSQHTAQHIACTAHHAATIAHPNTLPNTLPVLPITLPCTLHYLAPHSALSSHKASMHLSKGPNNNTKKKMLYP